jgi:tRNA G18 (ribose-2'-O)-methylase SpoU
LKKLIGHLAGFIRGRRMELFERVLDYRIVATTAREGAMALEDFDVQNGKFALFFGSERMGLTDEIHQTP